MDQDNLFTYVHPHFFESISRLPLQRDFLDHLKTLLPEHWLLQRWDVWVGATYEGAEMPPQGFKIHVSSTPPQAKRVLDLVVPELARRDITFKITGDPRLLGLLLSKRFGRAGSGKFMTIYPPTEEAFRELIEALYQKTRGEELAGPYILSDRRYRDSRILYYRYGGMRQVTTLTIDGSQRAMLVDPSGELVPDERVPYFRLPGWVEDPFGGSHELAYQGEPVLKDRYHVDSVIVFSNAGGVYRGTDRETGREVIIKEARPFSHFWWGDGQTPVDAITLLEREFHVLRRLGHLGFVPEAVDLFAEWEHTFLVESVVEGLTFQQFWNNDERILAPYVRRPGRVEVFVRDFQVVARRLIDALERIHAAGVIFGDLSPNNIFIDPETLEIALIDFESAHVADEGEELDYFTRQWGTLGFINPGRGERSALGPEDDFYALGMVLYGAVAPVQNLFALHPSAQEVFLDRLVGLGVPEEVRGVIEALLRGDPAAAREILAAWEAYGSVAEPAYA